MTAAIELRETSRAGIAYAVGITLAGGVVIIACAAALGWAIFQLIGD